MGRKCTLRGGYGYEESKRLGIAIVSIYSRAYIMLHQARYNLISCDTHHSECQTNDTLQIHTRYARARHRRRLILQVTSRYGTRTKAHPIHADTNPPPRGAISSDTTRYNAIHGPMLILTPTCAPSGMRSMIRAILRRYARISWDTYFCALCASAWETYVSQDVHAADSPRPHSHRAPTRQSQACHILTR